MNKSIATMLSTYVNKHHDNWDLFLPFVLFAYRSSVHGSSKYSPFELVYGRKARLGIDVALDPQENVKNWDEDNYGDLIKQGLNVIRNETRNNSNKSQLQQNYYYDKHNKEPKVFEVGDKVWVWKPINVQGGTKKLTSNWRQMVVKKKISNLNYRVKEENKKAFVTNISKMKPYTSRNDPIALIVPEELSEDEISVLSVPSDGKGEETAENFSVDEDLQTDKTNSEETQKAGITNENLKISKILDIKMKKPLQKEKKVLY